VSEAPLTALRKLPAEMRMAGIAAAALAFTVVLPWYEKSFFDVQQRRFVTDNLSALQVFTFVEAAVLLVALAVLFLVWARSQQKGFHLPGGDGVAITLAGGWAELLLIWRLFDKPDVSERAATVGIAWGMFAAMVAAGAVIAAGARVRAAHRPEPPNPAEDLDWERPPRRQRSDRPRAPRDPTAVTQVLGERPTWEGEVREPPGRSERPAPPAPGTETEGPASGPDRRPTRPDADPDPDRRPTRPDADPDPDRRPTPPDADPDPDRRPTRPDADPDPDRRPARPGPDPDADSLF
jgi:hypothetical protein